MIDVIQPMPELADEQLASLRADIAANGILVPVVVDQHGRILDGNHRAAIATELGMDYPTVTVTVEDDEDAFDKAVSLNCARRHLSREQRRELIRSEMRRRPDDSDRAIAKRVGCSPSTVGSVRSEVIWAEEMTEKVRGSIDQTAIHLFIATHRLTKVAGASWDEAVAIVKKTATEDLHLDDETGLEPGWFWDTVIGPRFDQLRLEFREELSNLDTEVVPR